MTRHLRYLMATALVLACAGPGVTDVPVDASALTRDQAAKALPGTDLIECPANTATSAVGLVTPLGGVVTAGGMTIVIPPGALTAPTLVQVNVPASNLLEVDISVPGVEHFVFELPVTVTISYARCSRSNIDRLPLTAWYIDSETKALLEHMGGVDNKLLRTVTFTTPHLSGYALAN